MYLYVIILLFLYTTMKIIIRALIIIAVSQVIESRPHEGSNHTLNAGLGYTSHFFVDLHSSPLRYSNSTLMFAAQYTNERRRGLHRIGIGYDGGEFTTSRADPGRMFENYYRLYFEGGYTHQMVSLFDDDFRLFGGFYFDNILTHREHFYFEGRSDLFMEFFSAFHPAMEAYYRIGNRHVLRSRIGISPIAYIRHSPYSVRGSAQDTFQFFDSFRKVGILISYQYSVSARMHTEILFSLNYYRHAIPQKLRFATENLMIQFGYNL